jgi:hypothetical protein
MKALEGMKKVRCFSSIIFMNFKLFMVKIEGLES